MFNKKGFSLVELMIVVAIIGILAAIAIPNFVEMQYRAKRGEVPGNVDGIKTAEMAYDAAYDAYVPQTSAFPAGTPGKAAQVWPSTAGGFDTLGWGPDGNVRGVYLVTTTPASSSGVAAFTVDGQCDVDGNGVKAKYTASESTNAALTATGNNTY